MKKDSQKNRHILIIDDSERIHEDFRAILGRADVETATFHEAKIAIFGGTPDVREHVDFEIDSAFQGQEGLEKVRHALRECRPYAMAFVDIRMPPGWDGVETVRKIWQTYPELEVVICTAYSDYDWNDIVAKLGQTDRLLILKKPFDNVEVYQLACALTEKWNLARQAEATLQASETKYQDLYDNAPDMFATIDAKTARILQCNHTLATATGYSKDAIIEQPIFDLYHPDCMDEAKKAFDLFVAGEEVHEAELQLKRRCGTTIDVSLNISCIRDDQGHVLSGRFSWRDVTERKLAQKKIADLARFPRENPNPVLRISSEGIVLFANDASQPVLDAWGVQQSRRLSDTHFKTIEEAASSGKPSRLELQCPGGRTYLIMFTPVRGTGYVNVYGLDITDRKTAEERLQQQHRNLESMFRAAPVGMLLVDEDAIVRRVNDVTLKLVRKEASKVTNTGPGEGLNCIHSSDVSKGCGHAPACEQCKIRKSVELVLETGRSVHGVEIETVLVIEDTPVKVWLDISVEPVELDGKRHAIVAISNITDRKQADEMLKEAKRQAEEANRIKSQFLANMSHEIRTPMNSIIGFSEMLAEDGLNGEQRQYVNLIRESGRNLLRIINDILDFAKIEAGKFEVDMIECTLGEILTHVDSMLRPQAERKELKFEVIRGSRVPARIRTDPTRLRQCLVNLVSNAIKFTETGHVHLKISLETGNDSEPSVRFDVEDTGIGIAPQDYEKIFESFTQADGSTARKYGGTGLGLAITKRLTEVLGGRLSLTSEKGKGSLFSLVVPVGVSPLSQPSDEDGERQQQTNDIGKKNPPKLSGHVLVAEDVVTNQMLTKALLGRMGLSVTIAADGNDAVRKARAGAFDLILMDIQMPGIDGYQATRTLRAEGLTTPIIALTAHAMKGDDQKCIDAGCDDYLTKPLDRRKLLEKIQKYLGAKDNAAPRVLNNAFSGNCAETGGPRAADGTEILNWGDLMDRLGDEELIREVASIFLKDNKERIGKLAEAVDAGDAQTLKLYAHAIKGAARNLGAVRLSNIANRLECTGRQNDLAEATPLFELLKTELDKVMTLLSRDNWTEIAKREVIITDRTLDTGRVCTS